MASHNQSLGMRELASEGEPFLHSFRRTIVIAESPQSPRRKTFAHRLAVMAYEHGIRMIAMSCVEVNRLVKMLQGILILTEIKKRHPHGAVGFHDQGPVL